MKKLFMKWAPPMAVTLGLGWMFFCAVAFAVVGAWAHFAIALGALFLLGVALWPLRRWIAEALLQVHSDG